MKKIVFLVVIISLINASCDDVLDKAPLDIISEVDVFNDPVLAQANINRIYANMNFLDRETTGSVEELDQTTVLSDEGRISRPWLKQYRMKFGILDKNGSLMELWRYNNIRHANEFLEKIENSPFQENTKKEMIAQVKWARAITYFYMVKRYGGIPIITRAQKVDEPEEDLFVSRDTEMEVYDFIISEMDAIVADLPDQSKTGYPSKYAALALKSRAALYAASIATWGKVEINGLVGIPANEATRFWQAAYDASDAILKSGNFSLYNKITDDKTENFRRLFLDESNNPEAIFSWQYTGSNVNSSYDYSMTPFQYGTGAGNLTAVYLEMVESFENVDGTPGTFDRDLAQSQPWDLKEFFANKDPRFHASVNYEGVIWKGEPLENWGGIITPDGSRITSGFYQGVRAQGRSYIAGSHGGGQITGFNVQKYLDDKLDPVQAGRTATDFMVFRLGEILLNYAEAAFELNKSTEALNAINQLRERAGIALLDNITREKIRNERKVELAFENHRYWDLRRWRTAVDAISRKFTGIYTFYHFETGKFIIEMNDNADGSDDGASFLERHYYLPITPGRISNNPNLAPENPGY